MQTPPGWGADPVSDFLAKAQRNTFASFVAHQPEYQRLCDIDRGFREVLNALNDLPPEPVEEFYASFLCFRSHACFLAATGLSLAGQAYESAAVSRTGLECVLYGLLMARRPGAADVWHHRHDDAKSFATMRRMFRAADVLSHLEEVNINLGANVRRVYEMLIDLGAHPKPGGYSWNHRNRRRRRWRTL